MPVGVRSYAAMIATRRRKFWGWGFEDQQPQREQTEQAAAAAREHLGFGPAPVAQPPRLADLDLPAPRLQPPPALAAICRSDPYERALHAYGRSYRDLVRAFRGRFDQPPDVVAHPAGEADLERVLAWCEEIGAATIPFGGGTSVVGGVEPRLQPGAYAGAVTIDLGALDRVLDVDPVSRAARIQAGATGPGLEAQLSEHGLTLRHFPQSFEYSTLGGWIATRAGGHYATLHTHIDDFVESVRALTPRGLWESRRLPASGAGPSPDRLLIGSEGILGVITEAWVRVQATPRFKESRGVLFDSFEPGARAVRALAQSGLHPSNCRLLDPGEAALTGAAPAGRALLVLGFESADHPARCGDRARRGAVRRPRGRGAARRRSPRVRGVTRFSKLPTCATPWWPRASWPRPSRRRSCGTASTRSWPRCASASPPRWARARCTCRLTHVYPDGAAPYFTVLAPARTGSELEQWDEVKAAASETILGAGGTITHHHAVGRDHRPWYDRQRPDLFAEALRAAKAAVDPAAILNPGVLIDP